MTILNSPLIPQLNQAEAVRNIGLAVAWWGETTPTIKELMNRAADAFEIMTLVDWIVEDSSREGWNVEFTHANPEPTENVPLHCVSVFGDWSDPNGKPTDWEWKTFRGDTRIECLKLAKVAIEQLNV
jgi:hypothetical protein